MRPPRQTQNSGRDISAVPICDCVEKIGILKTCNQNCRFFNPLKPNQAMQQNQHITQKSSTNKMHEQKMILEF